MFQKYLITGASGFLGRAVLSELKKINASIKALVMNNDPLLNTLPPDISVVSGDICNDSALNQFFRGADSNTCVIHCAGIVSVASHPGSRIYRVNAGGTNNIIRQCEKHGTGKLVYVSSVHAIPEMPKGEKINEDAVFFPELVQGDYAKSKAIATSLVLEAAARGLNASVVFPSGIIGPGDIGKGSITNMLMKFISGKLTPAVKGGYDFVDVRDVAHAILACSEYGQSGHGYILSGQYASIKDILDAAGKALGIRRIVPYLPIWLARMAAPAYERHCLRKKSPLYFTPYAVSVLNSNSSFSRSKAAAAFGYSPRPLQDSVRDMVLWLKKNRPDADLF